MEEKENVVHDVHLRIYDLSNGSAQKISQSLLGIAIEGVWHTSIEVYDKEFYFQSGILYAKPGCTPSGTPLKRTFLGTTNITYEIFNDYLHSLDHKYNQNSYNLFYNNCNHFSNDCTNFLVNENIPQYILDLPNQVISSMFSKTNQK
ncbi:hypothetical protein BDAP_000945 [Binucleata daphniae]